MQSEFFDWFINSKFSKFLSELKPECCAGKLLDNSPMRNFNCYSNYFNGKKLPAQFERVGSLTFTITQLLLAFTLQLFNEAAKTIPQQIPQTKFSLITSSYHSESLICWCKMNASLIISTTALSSSDTFVQRQIKSTIHCNVDKINISRHYILVNVECSRKISVITV